MNIVEICLASDNQERLFHNVTNVIRGGGQRIELCSEMAQQGLTPSIDAIMTARKAMGQCTGLMVMIRPRAGDFCYNAQEISLMTKQINQAAQAGADGVVFGVLSENGRELNISAIKHLVEVAKSLTLQVGIHRAFDALAEQKTALLQLITLGVDRVLTSGTAWGSQLGALAGMSRLQSLVNLAQQHMEIVIAGGVAPENAGDILAHLASDKAKLSLHAYSSVLINERVESLRVRALVNADVSQNS
ncbi:copper homeostasis protein CutC [Thalassotalea insulae]|uniref:Copper homeostasis protein cutC homolog n=1 Tax=Thalassotalea insulae TaxID=2056778 RepID=A0ABQ6GPW8_9GAMM|nr:copper homeostasis protein CutC [Thalassotalea insulae]GLX77359.1 copper homeostasis protein CutC [Thalassotalea insulae]